MSNDILGTLEKDDKSPDCLIGSLKYRGRKISISIDPDGGDLGDSISLARNIAGGLQRFDEIAKGLAATELLKEYNSSWREYQKTDSDGRMIDVTNPTLKADEFVKRISLDSIEVTGDMVSLAYKDGGLFAGHAIFVQSFDGANFSDTGVDLFG